MSSYSLYRCAVLSISTSSLDLVLDRDSPIQILRVTIHAGGQSYSDGLNMKPEQFYQWRQTHTDSVVTTEPPNVDTIRQTFQLLKSQGYYQVIVTTPCRKISQTYNLISQVAPEMAGELEVHLLDTGTLCMPEGFFAQEAVRLLEKDLAPAEVITYLEQLKPHTQIIFGVQSLHHLVKSGAIGRMGATIGDWLQLKPVLRFQNGELSRLSTTRSTENALEEIAYIVADEIKDKNVEAYGLYCGDAELYARFAEKLYEHSGLKLPGYPVSPAVGAYMGADTVGVGIVEKLPLIREN